MANSDFWRDLAKSFQSVPRGYEFTASRHYYMELQYFSPTSVVEPDWIYVATPTALAEFDAMARRGASMLTPPLTGNLLLAWLEALWYEATHGPIRTPSEILGKDRAGHLTRLGGKIGGVFQASYALCRKFESEALQTEFEENKQNDPRNWSPLRANFEAFRAIKELHARPPERIPESLVRRTIAHQLGINPEEVTPKQINFAVASLAPTYGSLELIPDESPSPPHISTEVDQGGRLDPKALRDSYLAKFPDERIKIRDLCWAAGQHYREWKRWLAGEMKIGSTADLAFRRILGSGQRPLEFNKKPRPHGWE
jgi:hypothetical protein